MNSHQFQYAGYYIAEAKGFYRDVGLDVNFRELEPGESSVDEVVFGKAEYGVQGSDILRAWDDGKPVVSLAVIFEHSQSILIARSNITIPSQFTGKKIALRKDQSLDVEAMLHESGLQENLFISAQENDPLEAFIRGDIDGYTASLAIDPAILLARNVDFNVLQPSRYGVETYGDCLFTTRFEIEQHSERVQAFMQASLRGWQYALTHMDESVQLVHTKYAPQLDLALLNFEAKTFKEIFDATRIPFGEQDASIWQNDADQMFRLGLLHKPIQVADHVYSLLRLEKERRSHLFRLLFLVAVLAFVLMLVFSFFTWIFWRGMNRRNMELRLSEARLQQALRATSDAVWDWPNVHAPMWWSPVGYEMMGVKPETFTPTWNAFLGIVYQEDQFTLQTELDAAIAARATIAVDVRIMVQSSLRWIRFRALCTEIDGSVALSGIFQDIHQLKTAEIGLRESEASFRQYFELGLVGMATLSAEGKFIQTNRTLWDMLDETEEELHLRDWQSYTHPGDLALEEDLMEAVRRGDRQGYTLDKRFISAKKRTVNTLVAARAVLDSHGQLVHWVMLVQDISQRRQGEQEKEKILHQLSLKNRTLEGMLHTISHDFRHPLVNVMWYSQEMERTLTDFVTLLAKTEVKGNERLHESCDELMELVPVSLREIRKGAQVIDRMLSGMLSLSRLGRQTPDFVQVDMKQVVQALQDELRQRIEEVHAQIHVDELPSCTGSESMLYQVWENLLQNALHYRDLHRSLVITITGRVVRDWVVYSIEDNGVGIPASSLGHIFSPFFRLDPNGMHSGEGLGLTFVTRILESHRGHIKVESELGKGSRFSIYLPESGGLEQ